VIVIFYEDENEKQAKLWGIIAVLCLYLIFLKLA